MKQIDIIISVFLCYFYSRCYNIRKCITNTNTSSYNIVKMIVVTLTLNHRSHQAFFNYIVVFVIRSIHSYIINRNIVTKEMKICGNIKRTSQFFLKMFFSNKRAQTAEQYYVQLLKDHGNIFDLHAIFFQLSNLYMFS